MTVIPTLDISAVADDDARAELLSALRQAMATVGFLQIVGHGIELPLINRAHDTIEQIDRMPDQRRRALLRPRSESRGAYEKRTAEGRLLQRGFQFIPYDTLAEADAAGAVRGYPDYFKANVWPSGDPAFKATWDEYSAATRRLGRVLIDLFAQALGADTDYFAEAFRHDVTLYSANWYPSQPVGLGPDDLLLEQHADSGVLTVLHQRGSYEGLQILDRDGRWVTVPLHPEAFVINIGWLMNRWTNGRWPATMHRVVPGPHITDSRSSVAMHFLPNIDEVIAPLPALVGEEGALHAPITTYDWQREFMADYVLARHDWTPVREPA